MARNASSKEKLTSLRVSCSGSRSTSHVHAHVHVDIHVDIFNKSATEFSHLVPGLAAVENVVGFMRLRDQVSYNVFGVACENILVPLNFCKINLCSVLFERNTRSDCLLEATKVFLTVRKNRKVGWGHSYRFSCKLAYQGCTKPQ